MWLSEQADHKPKKQIGGSHEQEGKFGRGRHFGQLRPIVGHFFEQYHADQGVIFDRIEQGGQKASPCEPRAQSLKKPTCLFHSAIWWQARPKNRP